MPLLRDLLPSLHGPFSVPRRRAPGRQRRVGASCREQRGAQRVPGSAGTWGRSVVLVMARKAPLPVAPCAARHLTSLGALCLDTVWQKSLVVAGASEYCNMNI